MTAAEVTFSTIAGIRTAEVILSDKALSGQAGRGADHPILMLHGWGANLKLMQPLGARLAALGFGCYIPDLPGFGESDPPPVAWSVPDYTKFVVAYLDAHGLAQVNLFGHSFGGRLGLVLGAERPDRILRMALADAAGVPSKKAPTVDIRLRGYKAIRDGLYKVGAKGLADDLRQRYNRRYGSADFQAARGVMRETVVRVVNEDLRPYARRVTASTLLFWGDKDADTPLWQGQELEKLIPDAGLIVYEGAGHYSYLERLNETVKTVDYFFRQENP
ncbi:MAG: alpha/beta hydrolase [Anaerolineae bacterium]|nr:alpha/beta hydrolase [Anaerolineae bacterium]